MKAHELVNVLNHLDPQSEWDGGDLLTTPIGTVVSISKWPAPPDDDTADPPTLDVFADDTAALT